MAGRPNVGEYTVLQAELVRLIAQHEGLPPGAAVAKKNAFLAQPWGNAAILQILYDMCERAPTRDEARRIHRVLEKFRAAHPPAEDRRSAERSFRERHPCRFPAAD